MTVAEYRRWLRRGLGRAVLHLDTHDAAPYRRQILYACLHSWSYDRQCEPSRAGYMFDIIQRTGEPQFYRDAIMKAMAERGEDWDPQLYDLLQLFAGKGDVTARQLLYGAFAQFTGDEFSNGHSLIELDGLDGFLFVADKIGSTDISEYEPWVCDSLFGLIAEKAGAEAVWDALAVNAIANPNIERFVGTLREFKAENDSRYKQGPSSITGLSYEVIKPQLLTGKAYGLHHWGELAPEADILLAAKDLLSVTVNRQLADYLRIFRNRSFPLDARYLIALTRHNNPQVASFALRALANVKDKRVRNFGLELMASRARLKGRSIEALTANFEDGDYALVEGFALQNLSPSEFHDLAFAMGPYYEANPNVESESQMLLRLYDMNPCGFCRESHVRRLLELNRLPEWMRAECGWDANPDTRRLVKEIVK